MINSVLSGLLILIGAVWAYHAFNRLWQQSLAEEATEALAAATQLGLTRQGPFYGPRIAVSGTLHDQPIRIEWRGGLRGARTTITQNQITQHIPMLTTAAAVHALLNISEE